MTSTRPTGYRPNVGAILKRPEDGAILLAERIDMDDVWQLPQGGVDAGESHEEALWREVTEELGLLHPRRCCDILGRGPATRYDFDEHITTAVAQKYRGQEQTLFVLAFHGKDEDIALNHWHAPEFQDFGWFAPAVALRRIWDFKRPVLAATIEALPELFGGI